MAFYVGWESRAPASLARWSRAVVVALAALIAAVTATIAVWQRPLPAGVFEFGVVRTFEGVLYERPLPMLRVAGPDGVVGSRLLLVGFGKHGLPEQARGHHAERVRFRGSLIFRQGRTMVEMNDLESFEVMRPAAEGPATGTGRDLGWVELVGELVDTKCWLGVMRPASGKVHRACAVRCLAGGIPPGLLTRHPGGETGLFLLSGPAGFDPQLAGRQIRVSGRLELHDDLPVIQAEALEVVH